jgi:putative membrane protein
MRRSTIAVAAAVSTAIALVVGGAAAHRPEQRAAVAPSIGATDTIDLDDATIVAIFDAANSADIETGDLAAKRGSSEAVREFGAMLARDHEVVRQKGRDLAARLGVKPTPPADDASARAHAEAMASLRALRGAAFDRAFLRHEAAFHDAVIDAVQSTLLPAIDNPELRDLVVKVAPAFQAHMIAAQDLEKRLAAARGR